MFVCRIIVPTVPVYIAEISPKDMRGRLISLTGVVGSIAMLVTFRKCTCIV